MVGHGAAQEAVAGCHPGGGGEASGRAQAAVRQFVQVCKEAAPRGNHGKQLVKQAQSRALKSPLVFCHRGWRFVITVFLFDRNVLEQKNEKTTQKDTQPSTKGRAPQVCVCVCVCEVLVGTGVEGESVSAAEPAGPLPFRRQPPQPPD